MRSYDEMDEAIQGPVSILRDVLIKQAAGLAPGDVLELGSTGGVPCIN